MASRERSNHKLAVASEAELVFGRSPKPVTCGKGLTIGARTVCPELNFTLPPMLITDGVWDQVCDHYNRIGEALMLEPGFVIDLSHAVVCQDNGYARTLAAVRTARDAINKAATETS